MRNDILDQAQIIRQSMNTAANVLTDEQAAEAPMLYYAWSGTSVDYAKDDRVQYKGAVYKCLAAHTSQEAWTPTDAPSLWAKLLIPTPGEIPEWEQPSSTNPYMKGDKVKHNGKTWKSLVDNNVWEPGATGTESLWAEVTE